MRALWSACVVVLLVVASCDRGVPAEPAAPEVALRALGDFKAMMCKCSDRACAQAVSDKMLEWSKAQAKKSIAPPTFNAQQQKRLQELGEGLGDCMTKAFGAAGTDYPAQHEGNGNAN